MNWDDLHLALAISRGGTLTAAARELGVVRTTVGRRLETLEENLGVRLFDRTEDGFAPTAAGQDLVDVAVGVESEIVAVQARVSGLDAKLYGSLRVSIVDFAFQAYSDVFGSFVKRYPGIELTVCANYDAVSLRRHEADVAMRLVGRPPEDLDGVRLCPVEFGIYLHRDLIDADAPIDLNSVPWLRTDVRKPDPSTEAWMARNAPKARTSMRFDSYPVLRTAVSSGIGAHMLTCMDGDADKNLVRIVPDHGATIDLWALTLPEMRTNSRVRAFLDHVTNEFGTFGS